MARKIFLYTLLIVGLTGCSKKRIDSKYEGFFWEENGKGSFQIIGNRGECWVNPPSKTGGATFAGDCTIDGDTLTFKAKPGYGWPQDNYPEFKDGFETMHIKGETFITSVDRRFVKADPKTGKAPQNTNTRVAVEAQPSPQPTTEPTPLQSTSELTRETVLALLRNYRSDVKTIMPTSSRVGGFSDKTDVFVKMMKAKVISCKEFESTGGGWVFCTPGPNGRGLFSNESPTRSVSGTLGLVVGHKVPTEVTGISRINDTSAFADVVFTFERNENYDLYNQWPEVFRRVDMRSEQHRAFVQLYDDGWRVVRVD